MSKLSYDECTCQEGRHWNNADDTSGQYHECNCCTYNDTRTSQMTCEEFFDTYFGDDKWSNLADEMYWDGGFNAELCWKLFQKYAAEKGVTLTDLESFNYEEFFWEAYRATEKGLS